MENEYLHCFELLKRQLVATCRGAFPFLPEDLQVWKGTDIACFQEVLEEKTKGRISEKSFYNYFKMSNRTKLPREDVLDMFAQMVGEINWKDFVRKNKTIENPIVENTLVETAFDISVPVKTQFETKWKMLAMLFGSLLLTSGIFYAARQKTNTKESAQIRICFEDIYTHRPIVAEVEVHILDDKAKNVIKSDSLGCVAWEKGSQSPSFWIKSPYYKADTFAINGNQTIMLKPDDYAMMIRLYASGKIEDWEAHLGRLQSMFAEDAEIFQIETETGFIVEVWNKAEFIEKLTIPIPSLQKLEVLETEYNSEKQIKVLRFWQK